MNYITFDIETYSPSKSTKIDKDEFRISVTGAYISWLDKYIAFFEDQTAEFIELMKSADLIIGYNHIWFDLRVMQKYASNFNLQELPCYDIMLELEKKIGYKVKLDNLCTANFGEHKTDTYENYKDYYWDKNWFPLIDYCMNDVRLTEKLFKMAVKGKPIKYTDLQQTREMLLDKPKPGQKNFAQNDFIL